MRSRLLFLVGALALWLAAIGARLYDLQVVRHEEFTRRAERQQQRVIELDPPRGTIFDARGRELAVSVEVESAFAVPREVEDVKRAAAALARVLGGDRARLERLLASDREFVWVARKLDPPQARAARDLDLAGVYFLEESKRYYPLRETAAQVLGYVGTDNHGLAGLEAMYEKVVAGKPGRRTVLRDAKAGMAVPPDLPSAAPVPGRDVYLTLDAALQGIAERELAAGVERLRARSGSVVLLDPSSGAVLAMASYPTFDPNRFGAAGEEAWRNRVVADAYEPGSTFKMVTAAAALEQGLITPDERIDCEMGGITLAGVRIADHKAFGTLSFREVIAKSSNVGTIKTALRVANRDFYATIRAFGFGRTTGIDLPGESPGLLMPVERWPALAKAYMAFGQGLSVTPLQLVRAFGAVANGGRLLAPYVVRQIGAGADAQFPHPQPVVAGEPVSPRTIATLRALLAGVTQEGGTAKVAALPGYPVAGKTGTAQKYDAATGGYGRGMYMASFAGIAPADHPRIVGVVVIDEPPRDLYYGGQVAAPVFREIVLDLMRRGEGVLGPVEGPVASRPPAVPAVIAPDLRLLAAKEAERRLRDFGLRARFEGQGPRVLSQSPAAGQPVDRGGSVTAWLSPPRDSAHSRLPDLSGLPMREALRQLSLRQVRPRLSGHGLVVRQDPPPGTPLPIAGSCRLWCEVPDAPVKSGSGASAAAASARRP